MARGRHQEQNQQRRDAERLERKADELAVVRPGGQLGCEVRQVVLHLIPFDHEPNVQRGDDERGHAEMTPVVQQRQKAAIDARQRPDAKDDGQHHKRATSECTDVKIDRRREILRRIEPFTYDEEGCEEQPHGREQDGVVDDLGAIPLDGAESDAHRRGSSVAGAVGAEGSGRKYNAIANPSPTASASAGHSMRWTDLCERVIAWSRISAIGIARRAKVPPRPEKSACARRQ